LVRFTRLVKNYKAEETLGYFSVQDPKVKENMCQELERHGRIFNSGHFRQLFDVLIEVE
jgi:hypothetical protein